jgi:hypothetical protein
MISTIPKLVIHIILLTGKTLGLKIDLFFSAKSLPVLKLYFKVQYLFSKFDSMYPN